MGFLKTVKEFCDAAIRTLNSLSELVKRLFGSK